MIRRPPRSTPKPSSAASDVYKRQLLHVLVWITFCSCLPLFGWRPLGKNEEASKVLETRLSKAKAGSDEEVSLKLCIAQVRETASPCGGRSRDMFYRRLRPLPLSVDTACWPGELSWPVAPRRVPYLLGPRGCSSFERRTYPSLVGTHHSRCQVMYTGVISV